MESKKIDKTHIAIQFFVLLFSILFAVIIPFFLKDSDFASNFFIISYILFFLLSAIFSLYFFYRYLRKKEKKSFFFGVLFLLLTILETLSLSEYVNLNLFVISKSFFLLIILFGMVFPKESFFTREWLFKDINYWRLFSLCFLVISTIYIAFSMENYSLWAQLISYIALFMGYANELRNEILEKKVNVKKK